MSYTIKTANGATLIPDSHRKVYKATNREDAIIALGELGINEYAAIRMLDTADGLRPADGVKRPYTVEKGS
jgi:hypothetical protein